MELYICLVQKNILDKLLKNSYTNLTSFVMCFEDAISEKELEKAESNVLHHLKTLSNKIKNNELMLGDVPLFFVRVREISISLRALLKN